MAVSDTNAGKRKNLQYYFNLQKSRGDHIYEYEEKDYPRGFTIPDKKIAESRYSPSLPRITQKEVLLFICYMICLLIFSQIYRQNRSYITLISFIIVIFMLSIPVFYLMMKNYYVFLMYIISILIFGSMGYGWGLLGVLMNLNPLKPKTQKKNNLLANNKSLNIKVVPK